MALNRIKKGPENIPKILKESSGLPKVPYGYLDKSFSFENMIYWENDPTFSYKPEIKA